VPELSSTWLKRAYRDILTQSWDTALRSLIIEKSQFYHRVEQEDGKIRTDNQLMIFFKPSSRDCEFIREKRV
jgi:hypothetical protein